MKEERVGPAPGLSLARLVGNARQTKQYDAYHNTTMEGYRITKEASDAVVNGTALPEVLSQEELRGIMAVKGYSRAFDLVIDLVRTPPAPSINEALILDLYVELFRPSVDEGIVTEDEPDRRVERFRREVRPPSAIARGAHTLGVRHHSPVSRRQRPPRASTDELCTDQRRLPVGDHPIR